MASNNKSHETQNDNVQNLAISIILNKIEYSKAEGNEEEIFNLRNLFETTNEIGTSSSECSFQSTEEFKSSPNQIEFSPILNKPEHLVPHVTDERLPKDDVDYNSKSTSISVSEGHLLANNVNFRSNTSEALDINNEDIFENDSLNSEIRPEGELKVMKITDNIQQQTNEIALAMAKYNEARNSAQSSLQSLNNREAIRSHVEKRFRNNINHKTSTSGSGLNSSCSICIPLKCEENNHCFEINLHNVPEAGECQIENRLKNKVETISLIPKTAISKVWNFKSDSSKLSPITKCLYSPSIDLKMYKTSPRHMGFPRESVSEIAKTEVIANLPNAEVYNEDDRRLTKHFTQNMIEIAKDVMKSIRIAILKSFRSFSFSDSIYGLERKTVLGTEKQLSSDNNTQNDDLKPSQSGTFKSIGVNNEYEYRPAEQSQHSKKSVRCVGTTKRLSLNEKNRSAYLKRQLELHQLRVEVERKRLQILDLKLAREYEEIQRDNLIFEKYFLRRTVPLHASHDSVDI